ncbi:TetR/AcrR family transcriptional regulator [Chitinophaga sp. NPDC101104]|uniref:TetR/AcrR family transcriptional regulator n=1 Tax=Chitinophaga sp. NPDC101104 TaxID=3390561 RepID=UPI003D08988D
MDTKSRILETALALYNEQGIQSVTSRHIAAEMGISPGNLHYHFRHTDDIIVALYEALTTQMDALVLEMERIENARPEALLDFAERTFPVVFKYRFIFLHFPEIGLRVPSVKQQYTELVKRREKEFLSFFKAWQEKGIFRKDVPPHILQTLVTQIFLAGDYWLSHNELTARLKGKEAARAYRQVFAGLFWPYLTEKGRKKFSM